MVELKKYLSTTIWLKAQLKQKNKFFKNKEEFLILLLTE